MKKKKQYLIAVILLAVGTVLLGFYSFHGIYAKRENLLSAYEKEQIPGIVCFGDSLTEGAGGNGVTFPKVIEERLRKERIYIPVVNMGVGGENSCTIAGRAGGIPFRVKSFTIPAKREAVQVWFQEEEGKSMRLLEKGDLGVNPCIIYGVEGVLSCEIIEGERTDYYFTRSEEGEAVEVPEESEVQTWASRNFKDYIYIVFIGANKGYADSQDLISQQRSILALQEKNAGKYLVIGLPNVTGEESKVMERAMEEAYGDKYINLREYISTQGIYDAGIKPNAEDLEQMELGKVPPSLLTDHIHFNAKGYTVIGNLIYERMDELGYFDELQEAVKEYGGIW